MLPSKECKIKAGRRAINSARKGENNEAPVTIQQYNNKNNLQGEVRCINLNK